MSRHGAFAAAATLAVVIALVLGFWNLGGHGNQREVAEDEFRTQDLGTISRAVDEWHTTHKSLPPDLKALMQYQPGLRMRDPETQQPYEYSASGDSQYQLCATFLLDSRPAPAQRMNPPWTNFSFHSTGKQCFQLNAVRGN